LNGKSEFPRLEAQVILAHTLGKSKTWLLTHPETTIPDPLMESLSEALIRLQAGVPLSYITCVSEFFGHAFSISPSVLIPRPETELLVEKAIQWLSDKKIIGYAADIGTGSGCIAVSLSKAIPTIKIIAVDSSMAALNVARENIFQHKLSDRINLVQGNLLDFSGIKMDLICANLPYIPTGQLTKIAPARYEPISALDGGLDGMSFTRELIKNSRFWLHENGLMLIEFETGQEDKLADICNCYYPPEFLKVYEDLSGKPRLLSITRSY